MRKPRTVNASCSIARSSSFSKSREKGPQSPEGINALFFARRIWVRFIEDLGSSDNELDAELRANLISVGIWILKESERLRNGAADNFDAIIEISGIIRDGLK